MDAQHLDLISRDKCECEHENHVNTGEGCLGDGKYTALTHFGKFRVCAACWRDACMPRVTAVRENPVDRAASSLALAREGFGTNPPPEN